MLVEAAAHPPLHAKPVPVSNLWYMRQCAGGETYRNGSTILIQGWPKECLLLIKARYCCAGCAVYDDLISRVPDTGEVICEGIKIGLCFLQKE